MWFVAEQAADVAALDRHYGNLIFMGCFFIAALLAAIWWLKRSA